MISRSLVTGTFCLALLLVVSCAPLVVRAGVDAPTPGWSRAGEGMPSQGCDREPPPPPRELTVDGRSRTLIVRVPEGYRQDRAHDLVVAFHGRTNPAERVRRYYDLDEAMPDAIIVYPSALPEGAGFRWDDPGDAPGNLRDFDLFDAIVWTFSDTYCIDRERVFVVGHSLGASFANSIACYRGATVRAVASVAGGIQGTGCDGGVAALLVHHPEDRLVALAEGLRARDALLSANGITGPAVPSSEPELAVLGCVRFGREVPNPVVWCEHTFATTFGGRYYPHNWPDATAAAIARFFADLP